MSRCCGNCEWSISPEDEENILRENGYDDCDLNRPRAGDCCIGQEHDENYCCGHHSYIEGMEEYDIFVLYDDQYFGPGYMIVSKLDEEIVKFMKISTYGEGIFPNIIIRAYEKDKVDNPNEFFRNIEFEVDKDSLLYGIFNKFTHSIENKKIYTSDSSNQGKNHFYVSEQGRKLSLNVVKDVYGVKNPTNFVDIFLGDYDSCSEYLQVMEFYKNLSTISVNKVKQEDIKMLLKK